MTKKSDHNSVTIRFEDPEDYQSLCAFAVLGDRGVSAQARRMLKRAIEERRAAQPALPEAPQADE